MIAACLPNPKVYTIKPLSRYVARRSGSIMIQMNLLTGDADIDALLK
jgi:monofunctional biosynthetic peptidoglycan transglycosylase